MYVSSRYTVYVAVCFGVMVPYETGVTVDMTDLQLILIGSTVRPLFAGIHLIQIIMWYTYKDTKTALS